jgi:hypothetical protein
LSQVFAERINLGHRLRPTAWIGSVAAKVIAAGLLCGALSRHRYDYYTVLRWIVCGDSVFTAYQAFETKRIYWLLVFASVAIVFNPVVPLHLKRGTWAYADIVAALLILVSIGVMDIRKARI